ncbi:MAG: YceI family protein [Phycisphaerales bacterium]
MISKLALTGLVLALGCSAALIAGAGRAPLAAPAPTPAAAGIKIDSIHSYVIFKIKHDGIGNNYGRFNAPKGTFHLDSAAPESSMVDVTIDAAQIDTGMGKRDEHLRSGDFFDVKQFPTITFKSKSAKKLADGKFELTGDLTLLGKSKAITVTAESTGETAKGAGMETTFTIKRMEFGMKTFADRLSDDVTITVALEGTK